LRAARSSTVARAQQVDVTLLHVGSDCAPLDQPYRGLERIAEFGKDPSRGLLGEPAMRGELGPLLRRHLSPVPTDGQRELLSAITSDVHSRS
jgi:hypothetical protein